MAPLALADMPDGAPLPAPVAAAAAAAAKDAANPDLRRLAQLGPGDTITLQVYGQPDMTSTVYVSDQGNISVPLVGSVQVAGFSPVEAGARVEKALRDGGYLNDPHVTITVVQSRSQRVAVLGEVRAPGRYAVDPNTGIFDLLAQAGGALPTGANYVYVLRPDDKGNINRLVVNLKGYEDKGGALPSLVLQGGDSVYVPRAEQYYLYGEVGAPNMYPLEPGMTVIQAIARAGGIKPTGSERRIEIKRHDKDGKIVVLHAKTSDVIQADDVIRVKESIF